MAIYPTALLKNLDAVALDLETTGLDPNTARIIQIGAVAITGGNLASQPLLDQLVNPGIAIPTQATAIHHISDGDVAHAPASAQPLRQLQNLLDGRCVIGYAIAYDLAVLAEEAVRANIAWKPPFSLDIRQLAERIGLGSHQSLEALAARFGVEIEERHQAISDARAAGQIFLRMLAPLDAYHIRTFAEALRAGGLPQTRPAWIDKAERSLMMDGDLYATQIHEVMQHPIIFAEAAMGDAQITALMIQHNVSSVLVAKPDAATQTIHSDDGEDDAILLAGYAIITERDMLRRSQLDQKSRDDRTNSISNDPAFQSKKGLVTIRSDDLIIHAIARMDRFNIRHLCVVDATEKPVGMVTNRDLLRHRATHAIMIGDSIATAADSAALAESWTQIPRMAQAMLESGVAIKRITRSISLHICKMTARAAELAERRMHQQGLGRPPCAYAVMVLGSAGREESLLVPDQDNAIIYGDDGDDIDLWFAELAKQMTDMLDQAGICYCKGKIMASNPAWRMSAASWRSHVEGWINHASAGDVLNADIFFDAAIVHGDLALGEALLHHARTIAQGSRNFAQALLAHIPGEGRIFGAFGRIRTRDDGRVDLKFGGLFPLTAAARAIAIRENLPARSTAERIEKIGEAGIGSADDGVRAIQALHGMQQKILVQQLDDLVHGLAPTTLVAFNGQGRRQKKETAEALRAVLPMINIAREGRL
ncbi:MAG: DUF294 nucleotidyltransferase-like domain-containing protein [Pseudomonadota bacterium]